MNTIKRWAFFPLLYLLCLVVAVSVTNPDRMSVAEFLGGTVVAMLLAGLIDRRRRDRGRA